MRTVEEEVLALVSDYGVRVSILKVQVKLQKSVTEKEQKDGHSILQYLLCLKKNPDLLIRLKAAMN